MACSTLDIVHPKQKYKRKQNLLPTHNGVEIIKNPRSNALCSNEHKFVSLPTSLLTIQYGLGLSLCVYKIGYVIIELWYHASLVSWYISVSRYPTMFDLASVHYDNFFLDASAASAACLRC